MARDARGFTRKHSLVRLLQRVPGVRALISRIRPAWYFKITLWSVTISSWFWPHTMGRARFFREVLRGHFSPRELSSRTRRYLYHARLVKDIEIAWMHWGHRYADWITVDGESYLRSALAQHVRSDMGSF